MLRMSWRIAPLRPIAPSGQVEGTPDGFARNAHQEPRPSERPDEGQRPLRLLQMLEHFATDDQLGGILLRQVVDTPSVKMRLHAFLSCQLPGLLDYFGRNIAPAKRAAGLSQVVQEVAFSTANLMDVSSRRSLHELLRSGQKTPGQEPGNGIAGLVFVVVVTSNDVFWSRLL